MTTLSPGSSSLPVLPVPEVSAGKQLARGGVAFTSGHHFTLDDRTDPRALGEGCRCAAVGDRPGHQAL
jgi:hypothetical protein